MYRILYVDDEPDLLEISKTFLERNGEFIVDTITSAPAALTLLNSKNYDAIVSDYQMPGMNGIEFLKTIRASEKSIPFILFTGKGREEVVILALNAGADFYLQKGGEPRSQFVELSNKIRYAVMRKRAEEALRESEQRYRHVIEDQTEFICRFLPDGTQVFVNEAYCRYFGLNREEILGCRFRPEIPVEDQERVKLFFASLTPGHPIAVIEHRIIMPDHTIRWQRWSDRAIFDTLGTVIEYQSVGRDIMEEKELEMEMKYHELELKKFSHTLATANRKLNLLTSITRHDINNQLTALLGYLEILEIEQPDFSCNEYFLKVTAAAKRISAMIQFTKEYENIGVQAPAWQDCRTLADNAIKDAPLGKIVVKNDLPAGSEVLADELIVKVFYNLMDNAVRYGRKITTIRFFVENRDDDHILVCEDDGVGIPAGEKEKIFDRGFGKNTGLGLALAREILDITGITIHETGEPGKGARFEMLVPEEAYRSALPVNE
ncbi:MAG: response regulator [Methanoregula sp.]|nr:response regulator [Methanoregula sp.]